MKRKLIWAWFIGDIAISAWIGWQIANAEKKSWARKQRRR